MLSIIVYGRNDNHGTNYHKRVAVSLNCLAATLTGPGDEIVFVDYNTPNDLPTLIEAIQDTLTETCKRRLRTFRVRPDVHPKTKLPIVEPLARNIAIRRTRPQNRWILSTNPDMILVPKMGESLTDIVSTLADGFYLLPRFELPETFWELTLERANPQKTLSFLRDQKYLNTITRREGFLKFDNPGDFQLMLRDDIFRIGGFDERMVRGWHVDSNLCKRISLLSHKVDSLEDRLSGYHCNHTRQESILHSNQHAGNSWSEFVGQVATPFLEMPNWGLADVALDEIPLSASVHAEAIERSLSEVKPSDITLNAQLYNRLAYPSARVLPFLADHIYHLPKTADIVYIGYNQELLRLLTSYLENIAFRGKVRDLKSGTHAALFIFDFGFDENDLQAHSQARKKLKTVRNIFLKLMKHKKNLPPHAKFIGVNALRSDFNPIFERHLSVRKNSYISGHVYGYLPSPTKRRPAPKLTVLLKNFAIYLVARHLYNHTDRIVRFCAKRKWAKSLFKSVM